MALTGAAGGGYVAAMQARLLLHPVVRDSMPPRERRVLMLNLGLVPDTPPTDIEQISRRLSLSAEEVERLLRRARLRLSRPVAERVIARWPDERP